MSDENPNLPDIRRWLGVMNRRFDSLERQVVSVKTDLSAELAGLRGEVATVRGDYVDRRSQASGH